MPIIQITKKEKKAYDREKRKEVFMRNLTLIKAKLLKSKLNRNDTRTIQVHKDRSGELRDYYISNQYIQTHEYEMHGVATYKDVITILEDYDNNRFVYKGMLGGADNAIGIVEFNVPISEVVADPNGNVKFQEMISANNALRTCKKYWEKIGESLQILEGHTTAFGKPDFVLGTLLKQKNGFEYKDTVDNEIEEILLQEREEERREKLLRNQESVSIDVGPFVVAKQKCWMVQDKGVRFDGINSEALFYDYFPQKPISTSDGKFVYVGKLKLGENKLINQGKNQPIEFVKSFTYDNIVLWTEGRNLIQYFLDKKLDGLNFTLGEIFTTFNSEECSVRDSLLGIIGGITLDEEGKTKSVKVIPESVKKVVNDFIENKEIETENIMKFSDYDERG